VGYEPPIVGSEGRLVARYSAVVAPRQLSQQSFLAISRISLVFLYAIIITGSLVRLTGSGLGCADWPQCSTTKFVDVSTGHAAIEQINRLFTGIVSAAVIAAVLGSIFVTPRRKSLIWLSSGLVIGVLAQVILGAVVVLTGLNPWSNMAHFLVSLGLVTTAVFLVEQAGATNVDGDFAVSDQTAPTRQITKRFADLILGLCGLAIILGTLVTGAGPHAGDENAIRLSFNLRSITRIHSATVLLCIAATLIFIVLIRRNASEWMWLRAKLEIFLFVAVAQGGVGYLQYFSGVPAQLVAVHVAFAVAVWITVLRLWIATRH
jgi:cytochrome c oxidase assembly protein subunit 15